MLVIAAIVMCAVLILVLTTRLAVTLAAGGVTEIRRMGVVHQQMRRMRAAVCEGPHRTGADAVAVAFAHNDDLMSPLATTTFASDHVALLKRKYGLNPQQLTGCIWSGVGGRLEMTCPDAAVDAKVATMPRCPRDLGFRCRTSYAGYTVPRVRCVYSSLIVQRPSAARGGNDADYNAAKED